VRNSKHEILNTGQIRDYIVPNDFLESGDWDLLMISMLGFGIYRLGRNDD
jgi:hypothetical protein